jgi:hypothetical protein
VPHNPFRLCRDTTETILHPHGIFKDAIATIAADA